MIKVLAFGVHVFTASGIVSAFYALRAISEGRMQEGMWWLLLCFFIDAVDGTFARLFKVKENIPWMDGKTIDYVIDFITYAFIPAFMMYKSGIFPEGFGEIAAGIVLMVSALYYGLTGMVSDDLHFVGFPVMWNCVAFELLFAFDLQPMWNFIWVVIFAIMHFVPLKFAYPSRAQKFFAAHLTAGVLYLGSLPAILYFFPEVPIWVTAAHIAAILWFGFSAFYTTFTTPLHKR